MKNKFIGEFIGTYLIVLFGCGAVAGAVLFQAFTSLFEVALIWGIGVTIAIFCSRNLSPAHLNPAVSLAMLFSKKITLNEFGVFITAQFIGAFVGGLCLYFIFGDSILLYEQTHGIVRGTPESIVTAQLFGEFFPNPGFKNVVEISWFKAAILEAFGTFLLVFTIFKLTEKETDNTTPFYIGLTVTIIICLIAPFTQAGLNPARDFGPRMAAYLLGWKNIAFPSVTFSFLTVYIIGPCFGALVAAIINKLSKRGLR